MRILYTCDATKTLRHDFKFDETFTDIISSSDLPMWKRPEAKKMKKVLHDTVVINHYMSDVFIESITMLGNTPTEILEALKYFSDERICIVSEKEKFRSLSSNYSEKTSQYEMLVRTLKSLSEFDVVVDAETNKVLNKYSNVVHELKLGYSMRNVAEICKVSLNTVKKVKKLMES